METIRIFVFMVGAGVATTFLALVVEMLPDPRRPRPHPPFRFAVAPPLPPFERIPRRSRERPANPKRLRPLFPSG